MGHPIRNDALDAKVREMRASGGSISGIARECGIGVNRVRRICGLPLPPSQRPSGQKGYVRVEDRPRTENSNHETRRPTMKSITIPLTETAHARLSAIAETAYLSPEAFAATLLASYLSYQPEQIVLTPAEPDGDDAGEEDEEDGTAESDPGSDEDSEGDEPAKPRADATASKKKGQWDWIQIGQLAVLVEDDKESLVRVSGICTPDLAVRAGSDKVRVKRPGGAIVEVMALELDEPTASIRQEST